MPHRLATLFAAATLLTGCASAPPARPASPLEGTYWRLSALGDRVAVVVDTAREPHIRLVADGSAGGRVTGSTGCNRLTGAYTRDGDTLRFGPAATTRMACVDEALAAQERALLAALEATTRHMIAGDILTLSGTAGPLARLVATVMR